MNFSNSIKLVVCYYIFFCVFFALTFFRANQSITIVKHRIDTFSIDPFLKFVSRKLSFRLNLKKCFCFSLKESHILFINQLCTTLYIYAIIFSHSLIWIIDLNISLKVHITAIFSFDSCSSDFPFAQIYMPFAQKSYNEAFIGLLKTNVIGNTTVRSLQIFDWKSRQAGNFYCQPNFPRFRQTFVTVLIRLSVPRSNSSTLN